MYFPVNDHSSLVIDMFFSKIVYHFLFKDFLIHWQYLFH